MVEDKFSSLFRESCVWTPLTSKKLRDRLDKSFRNNEATQFTELQNHANSEHRDNRIL